MENIMDLPVAINQPKQEPRLKYSSARRILDPKWASISQSWMI
jgi:hypothetical protein